MASCPKNHLETEIEIESSPVRPASPATAPCTSTAASTSGAADLSRRNSSAASTSGAADPISRNSYGYTVFLNHHGQDVKNTIASHIYHRLRFYGIEVFLDRPELRKGKNFPRQIKDALSNASIYVAIFSPKYAESEWCLNELLWMSQMQTEIIPVFYKIKPHELRQTDVIDGIYEQGLQKLNNEMIHDPQTQKEMQRFSPHIMALWRKALSETSKIEGFELDAFNGDEGVFVEKIVEAVLKKIKKISFPVAKHPVGLHVKVKEFEDTILLQQQQQLRAPRVVGIVGLSGVGKTALAKAILNCKRSSYDRSYFFSDISSDFCKCKRDFHIESVDGSIEMLKMQLSSNAIIVLDGVDHANQMDAVLPVLSVLGSDNLILITSRNKDVLTGSGVVPEGSIYELTGLNAHYSQQLFCFHAFGHSHPVPGFEPLVERFVETCQGLPSSLKLSGELVCRKTDPSYWKDQLDILPQNLARDMRDRLKSSYDGLLRDEKAAFLDTACFFKGERAEMAIRLWDALGFKGSLLLQALKNRSLVELDSNGRIEMYNSVRDVGREIAEEPSGSLPRLGSWKQLEHLLQQSSGRTEVRGIRTRMDEDDDSAELSSYRRWIHKLFCNRRVKRCSSGTGMRNVQFIDTEGCQLQRILSWAHSPNPIWLRLLKCPDKTLPYWFPLKNLRVLELSGCYLERLWPSKSQVPLMLRELVIDSPLSKLPKSIGHLKHLELMVLRNTNLKSLPESFGNLKKLKSLDLSHSPLLQKLPISFAKLRNLERLNLCCCNSLQELPDSFGDLTKLIHLDLSRSSSLETLPNTFGNLRSLQHLNLSYAQSLKGLPNSFRDLANLKHLDLSNCSSLQKLPYSFDNLIPLDYLDLQGCPNLIVSREILLNTRPSS